MKKCKFCQEELAENVNFCPTCGKPVSEEEMPVAEEAVQAAAEEPKTEPACEAAEEASVQAEEQELPAGKKPAPGKIALAVAAVVVLAAVLVALILSGRSDKNAADPVDTESANTTAATEAAVEATVPADGNPENVTCKGTYTVSDEEARAAMDTVVATIGDRKLTNGQLQAYYWSMVNSYLGSDYGYYMMMYGALDYTKPLDTQLSMEDQSLTWQQYFLKEALDYWQLCSALAGEAEKDGVAMSQADQEYLEKLPASLEETAASYSMTLDELILNNIGPGGTVEEFIDFQELYLSGKDYYQNALLQMQPTQEELEAFFEEHADSYAENGITKDSKYVDVRHILIQVEGGTTDENGATVYSDEEWADCQAEAQAALDQWLAGEKTEDSFAALANEVSEDPGSNTNGGLYENVYEGQMVAPFEQWCFDDSRAYGDYGLVQTSYGYHVMFYVGSEPMWISYAENDCITERSNAFLETLSALYPMDVQYENISLGYINLGG